MFNIGEKVVCVIKPPYKNRTFTDGLMGGKIYTIHSIEGPHVHNYGRGEIKYQILRFKELGVTPYSSVLFIPIKEAREISLGNLLK